MMDTIERELEQLGGLNFKDKEISDQRSAVKDALQFDKFAPNESLDSPCNSTQAYTNPAIEAYCDALSWKDGGWRPIDETEVLTAYPEYVPTDSAIETILQYEPILEVGAGAGYWAFVLSEAGGDVLPTDMLPSDVEIPDKSFWDAVGTGQNNHIELPRTGIHSVNNADYNDELANDKYPNTPWSEVAIADHSIVQSHSNHTIMSCHPPAEEWTEDLLDFIDEQQKFIFIGEWYPGPDATPMFFKTLTKWNLLETFPVYDWGSMHAHGYVFEKTVK